jgi:trehalose/maltose hydrolase-like predicted phosphorylase
MKAIVLGNGYLGKRVSQELGYPLFGIRIEGDTKASWIKKSPLMLLVL